MGEVLAVGEWKNNAELIEALFDIGYLDDEQAVCDPTFGYGRFWNLRTPKGLVASDLDPAKTPHPLGPLDATNLPYPDGSFDVVVIDAPYKLNGRPDPEAGSADESYGVDESATIAERHGLMASMLVEATRIVKQDGVILFKCMAQVSSGKVWFQPMIFSDLGRHLGLRLRDKFTIVTRPRPQPEGRGQKHARNNCSELLVFVKERVPSVRSTTSWDGNVPVRRKGATGEPAPSDPFADPAVTEDLDFLDALDVALEAFDPFADEDDPEATAVEAEVKDAAPKAQPALGAPLPTLCQRIGCGGTIAWNNGVERFCKHHAPKAAETVDSDADGGYGPVVPLYRLHTSSGRTLAVGIGQAPLLAFGEQVVRIDRPETEMTPSEKGWFARSILPLLATGDPNL